MNYRRVAVLRGGPSAEYDVSLKTGAGVINALQELDYFVKDIIISRQGEWLFGGRALEPQSALCDVDIVFIALHGAYGEDGTVQRLIERFNLPYVGSGPFSSRVAMNKYLTKENLKDVGVKMPKFVKLNKGDIANLTKTVHGITQLLGLNTVVKPVIGGSSIDTLLSNHPGELSFKLEEILSRHEEVLVEERIIGREATVGVLNNFRGEEFYVLPEVEIIPPETASFFSADVKYTGETKEICPGSFLKPAKESLAKAAKIVHKSLNLSQYSRSDFIVADDLVYFLEVNTLPALTDESLLPKEIDAVGSTYNELVDHLVKTAKPR